MSSRKHMLSSKTVYLFRNIQTKQVVSSLTRQINNERALKQLPVGTKHLAPQKLQMRKDIWLPLAMATFKSCKSAQAAETLLKHYKQLRASAPLDPAEFKTTKKARKIIHMDQIGESVADLAAAIKKDPKGAVVQWGKKEFKAWVEEGAWGEKCEHLEKEILLARGHEWIPEPEVYLDGKRAEFVMQDGEIMSAVPM
ncbi:hypothetical protein SAICODRAFT_5655 [Saitoella complicata NRRL Y-17804]|nr:uncharacterized protein SAICODRAFT_5655 [Saitoella complicata NRRL Y-17804]ODQ55040.1 hypothetical protein SAICODRAFT_5655 [Saitoella complicata NRRL Y-17804]